MHKFHYWSWHFRQEWMCHQHQAGSCDLDFVQTLSETLAFFSASLGHLYQLGSACFTVHWRCWWSVGFNKCIRGYLSWCIWAIGGWSAGLVEMSPQRCTQRQWDGDRLQELPRLVCCINACEPPWRHPQKPSSFGPRQAARTGASPSLQQLWGMVWESSRDVTSVWRQTSYYFPYDKSVWRIFFRTD